MNIRKKAPMAMVLAVLAGLGYGGYALVKEKDLESMKSGSVPTYEVARVIDGDTFELEDGDVVRLQGIDAPEEGECYYQESKSALKKQIEGKSVELRKDVTDADAFGRILRYAILPSVKNNILVDEYMVKNGYAVPKQNSKDKLFYSLLIEAREQAKKGNKGLWQACDYEPGEHSQKDVKPAKAECAIKGNISTETVAKVYFVPECNNYAQVKIDPARGEKYFCSESEAKAEGFVKARYCP